MIVQNANHDDVVVDDDDDDESQTRTQAHNHHYPNHQFIHKSSTHSLMAFATSLPQIDVSIAYAVWSACGTALVSLVMILWFGEAADPIKLACLAFIILGVVGLNLRDTMM